jgi:hypothetical protein
LRGCCERPWLAAGRLRVSCALHGGKFLLVTAPLQTARPSLVPSDNLLTDASVAELGALIASSRAAPSLRELDLSANSALTWRCCVPLAQLLGGRPPHAPASAAEEAEARAGGGAMRLRRLRLEGVQLGDKGAGVLAAALELKGPLQVWLPGGGARA